MENCANYYAIKKEMIDQFKTIVLENGHKPEVIFKRLETYQVENKELYFTLDRSWDGLHFLLTGYDSDDTANENKNLSQLAIYYAIMGEEALDQKSCIYFTHSDTVKTIVKVLEDVNIDDLVAHIDLEKLNAANLYPNFWYNQDKDRVSNLFKLYFEGLRAFYLKILANDYAVLITIG